MMAMAVRSAGTCRCASVVVAAGWLLASHFVHAHAAVTLTGDTDPLDPALINSSTDVSIGVASMGGLSIDADSDLSSFASLVGEQAGSIGTVVVTGAGSSWTNGSYLYVGHDGFGAMNVQAGGAVASTTGYIGRNLGSTGAVTVSGLGSSWATTHEMKVGYYGSGSLNIQNGATVNSQSGNLGVYHNAVGSASVSGAGSQWNTSGMYVGLYGVGRSISPMAGPSTADRLFLVTTAAARVQWR